MKQSILALLILTSLLSISDVKGQTRITNAHFKEDKLSLRKYLLQKLNEQRKSNTDLVSICYTSATFAKFSIDATGHIIDLTFSELNDTPQIFRTILTNIISSTDNLWVPAKEDGKPIKSKPFILPFIYQMEAGCSIQHPLNNGTDNALTQLFNFNNQSKSLDEIDCIVLKPIVIFSQK